METTDRYLFRGKRIDNGEWVQGDLIQLDEQTLIADRSGWADELRGGVLHIQCEEVIPESIGQFTGLTDKNGVKIFEGDVIKFQKFANWNEETLTRNTAKVIFKDGCFMWDIIKEGHNTGYYTSYQNEPLKNTNSVFGLEIIGNIYDK